MGRTAATGVVHPVPRGGRSGLERRARARGFAGGVRAGRRGAARSCVLLALLLAAVASFAGDAAAAQVETPSTEQLVERMRAAYAAAATCRIEASIDARCFSGERLVRREVQRLELAFARPDRFVVRFEVHDGAYAKGGFVARADAAGAMRWEQGEAAPRSCASVEEAIESSAPGLARALLGLLLPGQIGLDATSDVFTGSARAAPARETVAGVECWRIELEYFAGRRQLLWLDATTACLVRWELHDAKARSLEPRVATASFATRLGEPLAAGDLAWSAPGPERRIWPAGYVEDVAILVLAVLSCTLGLRDLLHAIRRRMVVHAVPPGRSALLVGTLLLALSLMFAGQDLALAASGFKDVGATGVTVAGCAFLIAAAAWPAGAAVRRALRGPRVRRELLGLDVATSAKWVAESLVRAGVDVTPGDSSLTVGGEKGRWRLRSCGASTRLDAPLADRELLDATLADVVVRGQAEWRLANSLALGVQALGQIVAPFILVWVGR